MPTATQEKTDFDPFQYFEGGKEGVRKRIGDFAKKGLESYSFVSGVELCDEYLQIPVSALANIVRGDYSEINSELFQELQIRFDIPFKYIFGRLNLSPEDKSELLKIIKKERFGVMDENATEDNLIELYLVSRTLHDWDK